MINFLSFLGHFQSMKETQISINTENSKLLQISLRISPLTTQ